MAIYLLVNVGALLRIFAPNPDNPSVLTHTMLGLSLSRGAGHTYSSRSTTGHILSAEALTSRELIKMVNSGSCSEDLAG